jgi:hypothetical protein
MLCKQAQRGQLVVHFYLDGVTVLVWRYLHLLDATPGAFRQLVRWRKLHLTHSIPANDIRGLASRDSL